MSEHRLSEIVIERPRGGMRISLKKLSGFKKQLHQITEEATQDGLLSPYLIKPRNKSKHLSDHLGPLRRFLQSHTGQPWNDVYSKLCQQLDTNTMTGLHVLSHVWDYVEQHVEFIDGIPYRKTCGYYPPGCYPLNTGYRHKFYVHPDTGMLCSVGKRASKRKKPEPDLDVVIIDEYRQYQKVNEIWYLITFRDFPPPPTEYVIDILKGLTYRQNARVVKGQRVYAASKQQCNKKAVRFIMHQLARQ